MHQRLPTLDATQRAARGLLRNFVTRCRVLGLGCARGEILYSQMGNPRMIDDVPVWSVPEAVNLKWRSWPGEEGAAEFVVFNTASGETHFLNLTAALVLRCLEEQPATAKTLMAEIRKGLSVDADASGLDQIPELLEKLDQVGLIARVPA